MRDPIERNRRRQDFRTGYYTLASPRALVAAQLVGAFIGVLFAPGVYAFYTHSFNVGVDYEYSVPYAKVRAPLNSWLHGALAVHGRGTVCAMHSESCETVVAPCVLLWP